MLPPPLEVWKTWKKEDSLNLSFSQDEKLLQIRPKNSSDLNLHIMITECKKGGRNLQVEVLEFVLKGFLKQKFRSATFLRQDLVFGI